jgi:hypothetical protein
MVGSPTGGDLKPPVSPHPGGHPDQSFGLVVKQSYLQ